MRKHNRHIRKLATCTNAGLAMFLITGLTGCSDVPDECKNQSMLSQKKIEDCKQYTSSGGHSTHGGGMFFVPTSTYSNSNGYSNYGSDSSSKSSTTSSSKSSGFFSSSSSSSHSSSFGG